MFNNFLLWIIALGMEVIVKKYYYFLLYNLQFFIRVFYVKFKLIIASFQEDFLLNKRNFVIMRKVILYLYFICVLLSGCGNQSGQKVSKNDNEEFNENYSDNSDEIYFLDFEQNLKNMKKDTFTINSIAKDISFIPLETTDKVLLFYDRFKIEKLNDGYLISTSSLDKAFHYIMMFDSKGYFIDYIIQKGQGPKELPFISEWQYNHNTQLLFASTGYQIILHSFENNTSNRYTLDGFYPNLCLLNDSSIIGFPNFKTEGDVNIPYLHFLNQEGKIIHSLYYPEKRNIAYNIPEGINVAGHIEMYGLYSSYTGDALFKDMFNDTIYRIQSMNDAKPYIIIHKGSLTPKLKDINNPTTGNQRINLVTILDTKKYFIINYTLKGAIYSSIWDKGTLSLIANAKPTSKNKIIQIKDFNGITKYRTPNGKEIFIPISNYIDGKLYCVLDAFQAMEFLPNIKEDDNPVLMVIELK